MTRYATIIGTGRYIPENEITNAIFAEWMGEHSQKLAEVVGKFENSSGIRTRFYAPDDWATSDLAAEAAKAAMADAGVKPEEIANVYCWLSSDEASYIHGAVISADGGIVLGT